MTTMAIISNLNVDMRKLAEALGLGGQPVVKFVLEMEVGKLATLYVKRLVTKDQVAELVSVIDGMRVFDVSEVAVADDCTVTAVRRE